MENHPTNNTERSGLMQAAMKAKKPRKQAISGRFWAGRTYRGRIKDDHKIDPAVGNGNPVDVSSEILNRVSVCRNRFPAECVPVFAVKPVLQVFPVKGIRKRELFFLNQQIQSGEELAPDDLGERFNGKEELLPAVRDPFECPLRSQASSGDDSVHMHMV